MGVSTDAYLVFGYSFDEDDEEFLPWTDHDDFESWYYSEVKPYKDLPESPFDEDGNWRSDLGEADRERMCIKLRHAKAAHRNKNPIPNEIELVWHCSGEHPMFIMTCADTAGWSASRGYPVKVNPHEVGFPQVSQVHIQKFLESIDFKVDPERFGWWLCSYWG